ncbi:MAG: alpha/beta fold hydrolase [Akkermansiaceae bacterium]|nr:alpha/beta fold hydrolase [Akkermansiaceae bacterium]
MLQETVFTNRHGEQLDTSFHPGTRDDRLVILGHGVTGNKDRPLMLAVAKGLAAKGWPCLRISFAGNGNSEGDFREATISKESQDLGAVIDQLPSGLRLAYAGHSMGGAVGVLTAARDPRIEVLINLAGMIRTQAFCEREFGEVTPDQGKMWDEEGCPLSQAYVDDLHGLGDLFDHVGSLSQPLLLIHGTADDVVLPEDSKDAYEAATEPKRLVQVEGAGHSFDEETYGQVIDAANQWLDLHLS